METTPKLFLRQLILLVALSTLGLIAAGEAWAQPLAKPHHWHQERRPLTPEQAREARQKGQVQPLRAVLKQTLKQYPGKLLRAELRHDDEQWVYTLVLLQEGGYLTKIWVDAQNGTVLQHQSRKKHKHRKHHENSSRRR